MVMCKGCAMSVLIQSMRNWRAWLGDSVPKFHSTRAKLCTYFLKVSVSGAGNLCSIHLDGGQWAGELCICLCVCVLVATALWKRCDMSSRVFMGDCHLQHTISYVIISKCKKGRRKGETCLWFHPGKASSPRICEFLAKLSLCPKPVLPTQAAAADSLH